MLIFNFYLAKDNYLYLQKIKDNFFIQFLGFTTGYNLTRLVFRNRFEEI